jgi:hypothetical protein
VLVMILTVMMTRTTYAIVQDAEVCVNDMLC